MRSRQKIRSSGGIENRRRHVNLGTFGLVIILLNFLIHAPKKLETTKAKNQNRTIIAIITIRLKRKQYVCYVILNDNNDNRMMKASIVLEH